MPYENEISPYASLADVPEEINALTHRVIGVCVARVRPDFLIESKLVLEIKSCECFTPIDRKQVLRYLQLTKLPLGLLVNFNVMVLKEGIKRVIRSEPIL